MLTTAAFICWRTGQVPLRLLGMAGALAALLAAMSAVLMWLNRHGPAGPTALVGLVPVAIGGTMTAREPLSDIRLRRGDRLKELDQTRSLNVE